MKNRRRSLGKLLIVAVSSFFLLILGLSMIANLLTSSVPRTGVMTPVFESASANTDKESNSYDPDKDNFGKDAEFFESKFGKDTIQPYERSLFKNGYLSLVPGADHARYIIKDFTITVAYVEGECVEIRYQRTTSPFLLDNYEIQQILNANSGGFTWRKRSGSIFDLASALQHVWTRDDGATATASINYAFIIVQSPAAKRFLETKAKEETEQRHREEPRF